MKFTSQTFRTLFAGQLALNPDAAAVTVGGRSCSWRDLDKKTDAIAGFLASKGVRAGSHVGLCAMNSIAWIAAFFAINRLTAHPSYAAGVIGALRRVLLGGAACGTQVLRRLLAAFPESCGLQIAYGLSEMAPITITDPGRSAETLAASVGLICPVGRFR